MKAIRFWVYSVCKLICLEDEACESPESYSVVISACRSTKIVSSASVRNDF